MSEDEIQYHSQWPRRKSRQGQTSDRFDADTRFGQWVSNLVTDAIRAAQRRINPAPTRPKLTMPHRNNQMGKALQMARLSLDWHIWFLVSPKFCLS
jgi:hypothetical protein